MAKTGLLKRVPNILTASRILFAVAYLILLLLVDRQVLGRSDSQDLFAWRESVQWESQKLFWAFVLFVIAGITDVIDGPMARAMNVTSSFGRTFDPFVDKILIGGGFIVFALFPYEIAGLAWWMVAVMLLREVLVTVLRSKKESEGKEFGATWAGKVKMFIQSFAIGTLIIYSGYFQNENWAVIFRDIAIWIAVVFTVLSALPYFGRLKK
jgi:CDP-diacylglycerol--glycerol-3-phosphate 3-phosphatidyltransferase